MKRIIVRPEVCLWVEFMLLNEFYRNNGLHKNMPEDLLNEMPLNSHEAWRSFYNKIIVPRL